MLTNWMLITALATSMMGEAQPVSERRFATQHRRHPRRRPGLLRPGLLRRRDPDAEPRRAGRGRAAVHAVLQHGAVLAVAGGAAHGLLRPAGPARHGAGRDRAERPAPPEVGEAAARDAPAARLSVVPLGQVARRRDAAGRRVRPLVLPGRRRALLPSASLLRGRPEAAAGRAGVRILRDDRHRRPRHRLPRRTRGEASRPAVLPVSRLQRASLPAPGAGRGHRPLPRPLPRRAGSSSGRSDAKRIPELGLVQRAALGRGAQRRPALRLPGRPEAARPGEVNRPVPWAR